VLAAAPARATVSPWLNFSHTYFDLDAQPCSCQVSIFRREQDGFTRFIVLLSSNGPRRPADGRIAGLAPSLHRVATEIHARHISPISPSPVYVTWVFACRVHDVFYLADMDFNDQRGKLVYEDAVLYLVEKVDIWELCGGMVEL